MSESDSSPVRQKDGESFSKPEHDFTPKLDPNGLPLRPQPSDDPKDPLNWPIRLKIWVLFQVSFLAFLGPFCQATLNSAFELLGESMDVSTTVASYATTVAIIGAAVAPIIMSPISNVYGRRPIFLSVSALGIAAQCAAGAAPTWGGILASRFFVGVGTSAGMGIGAAAVADMFFMHERGRYMGMFTVFVTNGAHVAALVGGPIAKFLGWRWCFWIPGMIFAANWVLNLFALPETLYHRDNLRGISLQGHTTWLQLFTINRGLWQRKLKVRDFGHVFYMLKYPSVLLPAVYYSIVFGLASVMFAVTGSAAFAGTYGFDTVGVGLAIGLPTFIGTLIGEAFSGRLSDYFLSRYALSHGGDEKPEARLIATIPGAFLIPIGVIIEGVTLEYKTPWIGPVMGIGIGALGLQVISTAVYAYVTDCYRPQSAEISTLLNFGRQTFSFTLGFYMTPFADATNYGIAWSVMAIIGFVLYAGIVACMWRGKEWRDKLGEPDFDKDI